MPSVSTWLEPRSTSGDRTVADDETGRVWRVHVLPGPACPGYRGAPCLVADCGEVVRRFWIDPAAWLAAPEGDLLALLNGPNVDMRHVS